MSDIDDLIARLDLVQPSTPYDCRQAARELTRMKHALDRIDSKLAFYVGNPPVPIEAAIECMDVCNDILKIRGPIQANGPNLRAGGAGGQGSLVVHAPWCAARFSGELLSVACNCGVVRPAQPGPM